MVRRIRQLTRKINRNRVNFAPRAEKVIHIASLKAWQLDDDHVDTEHLLLGLSREPKGGSARILSDLGVTYEGVRRRIPETRATGG